MLYRPRPLRQAVLSIVLGLPVVLALACPEVEADSEILLSPIVKSSLPGHLLQEDEVVPSKIGKTAANSSAGSIQNSLQNQLGVSMSDLGQPGAPGQIRGLGTSAEDVDVQALGISLNPASGGGFDLGLFPQFLWSGYQYQTGPSLGALNQSASSGTLSLTPWTVEALQNPETRVNASAFTSSLGVNQISAATQVGGRAALVMGYSSLRVRGPSAGLSTVWGGGKPRAYRGGFHLLASDLDSDSPGSTDFPSPRAITRKKRIIPLIQNEFAVGEAGRLTNSLFYDQARVNYSNPDHFFDSEINSTQWGTQNVLLWKDWRFGTSFRQVYFSDSVTTARQSFGNLQASYDWRAGDWLFQPTFQNIWVTDFGWVPQGSIGLRRELQGGYGAVFSRLSYSRRVPSLVARYSVPNEFGFSGNPALLPENDWTETLGWELKNRKFEVGIRGYGQLRQDAQVYNGAQVVNFGNAQVMAVSSDAKYSASTWLELEQHLTYAHSRLEATGKSFPYLANWIEVLGVNLHTPGEPHSLEWLSTIRFNSSRVYSPSTDGLLPAYVVLDSGLQLRLNKRIWTSLRVENLFDRSIEVEKGYPLGRSISFQLFGEI